MPLKRKPSLCETMGSTTGVSTKISQNSSTRRLLKIERGEKVVKSPS